MPALLPFTFCQGAAWLLSSPRLLLLFGLLGTVMVLTRKLDWYGVGKRKVES